MAEINETPETAESPQSATSEGQSAGAEQPRTGKEINRDARVWAMFCHLAGLAGFLPVAPVLGNIIAPLVIWQLKGEEFPFVAEQGRRAVNFQLSMLLYVTVGTILCLVSLVGIPLIPVIFCVVGLVDLIFVLIAAVKANRGEHYRYPLTIRFFK